jgi:hypothetical protein
VWHEVTSGLVQSGRVEVLGIVQEQHPDRARLFTEWKGLDWPILVDAYNELGVRAVPITVFIDEHGIVRELPRRARDRAARVLAFLEAQHEAPAEASPAAPPARQPLRDVALAMAKTDGPNARDDVIELLTKASAEAPNDASTRFALGVAYRMRYDSPGRKPGDFDRAVQAWAAALDLEPNQYIWRRRIQQYGPRLGKPYPFYDWVHEARKELRRRGIEPPPLVVEPRGSEIARPTRAIEPAGHQQAPKDAERITRDVEGFVRIQQVCVPPSVAPGSAVRVHLVFEPNRRANAYWNNEAGPMVVWVDPPDGWEIDRRLMRVEMPRDAVSREARTVELELYPPEGATPGTVTASGYALFNVCEGTDGECLYRRADVGIRVHVRAEP